jgi:hypothetical protein
MSAGNEQLAAGQYTVTWEGLNLGIFEGDAGVPTLDHNVKAEMVDNTSAYAKMTIDAIYQGADFGMNMTCIEWNAGMRNALWPYANALGTAGVIARRLYDLSGGLVLTVTAGTPAAVTGPSIVSAAHAILQPNFVPRITFGPLLRRVPLRFLLFPYDQNPPNNVVGHLTMT